MWDLLFRSVVAQFVAFRLCEDAEKRRIAVRYPMTESKAANEHGDAGQDGVEEIEGSHRADADEVEQSALDAQVGQGLMHALEDSICAVLLIRVVWHKGLVQLLLNLAGRASYTPQSQLRTFTARTAIPVPAATPAKAFFAPGSPWAKP
jgi:hypothetical protein